MRQDVKALADAMQKGWQTIPHMCRQTFFKYKKDNYEKIVSCCAIGHAFIGSGNYHIIIPAVALFPIMRKQKVRFDNHEINLYRAITILNDQYRWSTPEIIKWLRSHQND